jgi:biofilm PGA synthesis N-glycosyltransferase PgaC
VVNLFLFWGIWLLVPMLIDGLAALTQLASIFWGEARLRRRVRAGLAEAGVVPASRRSRKSGRFETALPRLTWFPLVTVILPVHNGSLTLGRALESVARQTYPDECLEVVCVDNGSTDDSFEVFHQFQETAPGLRVVRIPVERPGKSAALNAGIYASTGTYVLAVDADVRLAETAIYEMVRTFEFRPNLIAATGAVEIERAEPSRSRFVTLLRTCEACEYLSAFRVGRRFQSLRNSLYTLSGAFSAFRRQALFEHSYLYDSLTVSEDTKLTFDMRDRTRRRRPEATLECVDAAVAFVEPIPSLSALYSQRLRWQRGQVEVAALHGVEQRGVFGAFRTMAGRILLADHTLAFPRLVWTFLLPFLFLVGYSPAVVAGAIIAMYVAYAGIESLFFLTAYHFVAEDNRRWLRTVAWAPLVMPAYRFMVYWFRLAGLLHAVAEPQRWHTLPFGPRAQSGSRVTRS